VKTDARQLAINGGTPAFPLPLHVGRPNIGDRRRLMERIEGILDRRWLTNDGPLVQELEARIAALCGVKHCICTCNGMVALQLAARALGLTGEVIVPSFTFIGTAHALQWLGLTPVFCDIEEAGYNLDPESVEALVSPRTTGILPVHVWGKPCDVEALTEIASRHRLRLFFDAAHAFGCTYRGQPLGGSGDVEIFSFHATKFVSSGEGGALVTDDDELAKLLRRMRNFGFSGYDSVVCLGTNAKMSELSAAVGLTSLESMDEFVAANRRNHRRYCEGLTGLPGVQVMPYDDGERCNYQYVVLEIDERRTRIGRDRLVEILHAENVLARRYFFPGCHRLEPFSSLQPGVGSRLPRTEAASSSVLVLPTGTAVGADEISEICSIMALALESPASIPAAAAQAL
jgi:dTDP-4-amino-4,6-dideoxygalactose transaminase